jgi:hypothetical protein
MTAGGGPPRTITCAFAAPKHNVIPHMAINSRSLIRIATSAIANTR